MSLRRSWLYLLVATALLAACQSNDVIPNGPKLVSEVTLAPATRAPTRYLSPTPASPTPATPTPTTTVLALTETPVITFTAAAQLTDVTPTLAPSKTPTITPTVSSTPVPTVTPAPTQPVNTIVPVLVPTEVFVPPDQVIAAVAANPTLAQPSGDISIPLPGTPEVPKAACTSAQWFFTSPHLPDCPLNAAVTSDGAYEEFEYGNMIWVGVQDAIYVFYDSDEAPRWQVFQDKFVDGMPEKDPSLDSQAPPYADWQPHRGFGLIWRLTPGMIDRIGWAQSPYEQPYQVKLQTRSDGTIYISEPRGRVFALTPDGSDWKMYR